MPQTLCFLMIFNSTFTEMYDDMFRIAFATLVIFNYVYSNNIFYIFFRCRRGKARFCQLSVNFF